MKKQHKSVIATVWRHWKPTFKRNGWGVFFTFLFYSLSAYFGMMLKPTQWKHGFDALALKQDPWPAFTAVVILMGLEWTASAIGEYIIVISESNIIKQLRDYTMHGLLGKSTKFFTNYSSGGLVAKAKRFAGSSEVVVDQLVFSIIRSTLLVIYLVVYSSLVLPKVALIFLVWVIVFVSTTMTLSHIRMKYDLATSNADSVTTSRISDILLSIMTLRAYSRPPQEYQSFVDITEQEKKKRRKSWFIGNIQWRLQHLFMIILEISCMYYIVNQVHLGKETIGTAVMVQSYILSLTMNMWNFGQSWIRIRVAFADAFEMASLLDEPNVEPVLEMGDQITMHDNAIVLKNVDFGYLKDRRFIKGLNFHFKPGRHYGVIGKTGSGKTTLTKLIIGSYPYDAGVVTVGGNHIPKVNLHRLRSMISYVPQLPTFPSRSVREILTLGKNNISESDIKIAIQKASCDFVFKLPQGLDTEIGERGVKLSGGEQQRLAIAAAILKDAPIVIMDEPTSALDAETEQVIQNSIRNYFHNKTLIVIAHRLSTVAILDEVIYMKNGEIVASAPHEQLLEISEDYKHMWELQTNPQVYV